MSIFTNIFGRNAEFDKGTYVVVSLPVRSQMVFTIEQVLTYMTSNKSYYELGEMMLYNVPIRDAMREKGIGYVADRLLDIAPEDKNLVAEMEQIVRKAEDLKLADFDIQILPVTAPLRFHGQCITYRELMDCCEITRHVERWTSTRDRKSEKLHVANLYEPYPCFDSDDYANETRNYENFFISDQPFTEAECMEIEKLPHAYNYRYVVESLPAKYLPTVYRDGDSRFMLVATTKKNPQISAKELARQVNQ